MMSDPIATARPWVAEQGRPIDREMHNDRERLALSLRTAFPVSDCGSFAGLLHAIGRPDRIVIP
jgi:hypothetical protein